MNDMETEGTANFNIVSLEFLSDNLEADFSDQNTFDTIIQFFCSNADFFATQNLTDTENYFSQFKHAGAAVMIYNALADYVLGHWSLEENYKPKEKVSEGIIYKDICAFFQLMVCSSEQFKTYELTTTFEKIQGTKSKQRKPLHNIISENFNVFMKEIQSLKSIINSQCNSLDQIKKENKELKNELLRVSQKLDGLPLTNKNAFSFPPLTNPSVSSASSTNVTNNTNNTNNTHTNPLFSTITSKNAATPSASTKRPLENQNNNANKVPKPTPKQTPNVHANRKSTHPQRQIGNFNSFDPEEQNSIVEIDENEGFTTVNRRARNKNKTNINNNFNKKNNNNNFNSSKNVNNKNNNYNNTKRKAFKQDYAKMIGRGVSDGLSAMPKQFYIYLGKLAMSANIDSVSSFLERQFKSVKFNENETREVKFNNLKELNTDFEDRTFKSFSFSVSYLDKDVVKMKELFPLYSIVNQHRLSHAEWTTISQKYKKNTQNLATNTNQI
jgi:hypothetical protein